MAKENHDAQAAISIAGPATSKTEKKAKTAGQEKRKDAGSGPEQQDQRLQKRVKKADMLAAPLYNPEDFDISIMQAEDPHEADEDIPADLKCRFGDSATARCLIARKFGLLTTAQLARFSLVFNKGGKVRSLRPHEGYPLLDPDGNALYVGQDLYNGGNSTRDVSQYLSVENMQQKLTESEWKDWVLEKLYYDESGEEEVRRNHEQALLNAHSFLGDYRFDASAGAEANNAIDEAVAAALAEADKAHAEKIKSIELENSAELAEKNATIANLLAEKQRFEKADAGRSKAFRLANEHAQILGNTAMSGFYRSIASLANSAVGVARIFEKRFAASGVTLVSGLAGKLSALAIEIRTNRELLVRGDEKDSTAGETDSDSEESDTEDEDLRNKTEISLKIRKEKARDKARLKRNSRRVPVPKVVQKKQASDPAASKSRKDKDKDITLPKSVTQPLSFDKRQRVRKIAQDQTVSTDQSPADLGNNEDQDEHRVSRVMIDSKSMFRRIKKAQQYIKEGQYNDQQEIELDSHEEECADQADAGDEG